jgi:hypothetical protein
MPCPGHRSFVRVGGAAGYKCQYIASKNVSTPLVTVAPVAFAGSSLEELQTADPARAAEFNAERDRFTREIEVAYGNIDKEKKIASAFIALQNAENARDASPEAYQVARTSYYTLVKGDDWIKEERERVAKAEVNPEVQRYRDSVNAIYNQSREQEKVLDVINGVKDKVLSLRDDFQYSVSTFQGQLGKLKDQIAYDNRKRAAEGEATPAWWWLDGILNVLLAAVLIYAAYSLYRKVSNRPAAPVVSIGTIPR